MCKTSTIELLNHLRCSRCSKYLSYFPIHTHTNQTSICGRCQPIDAEDVFHNVVYETAMENFKFPCIFKSNGCTDELLPKCVPQHERWCEFRKLRCPVAASKCSWRGVAIDVYKHCDNKHLDCITEDGKFELDIEQDVTAKYMYAYGQDYFVITQQTDPTTNLFLCSVVYVGYDPNVEDFSYKITLKSRDRKKMVVDGQIGETVNIEIDTIREKLNNACAIVAEIDIFEKPKMRKDTKEDACDVNFELIEPMKCEVCDLYMLPPIFMCTTGHSICSDCNMKPRKCPTCKEKINKTQNLALAEVISMMTYPCRYNGCSVSCKSLEIRAHEAKCSYRPLSCPIENCVNAPISSEIYAHLTGVHNELVHDTVNFSCCVEEDEIKSLCFVIPHKNRAFIFYYKQDFAYTNNEISLTWEVQLVGTEEESKRYKFELDIDDDWDSTHRIYVKRRCGFYDYKQVDSYFATLTYTQVEPYLNDNMLHYRLSIIEENTM